MGNIAQFQRDSSPATTGSDEVEVAKWPLRSRALLIVGASAAGWAVVFGFIALIYRVAGL